AAAGDIAPGDNQTSLPTAVPTPEAWAQRCTALKAQCLSGPTLPKWEIEPDSRAFLVSPRQRRGPNTALRLRAVSYWAHSLEWELRWRVERGSLVDYSLTLRSEEHTSELQSLAYLVCR